MQAHWLRKTAVAVLAVSAGIGASAFAQSSTLDAQKELPGKPACFFVANVAGLQGTAWTVVDKSTLLMKVPNVPAGRIYLIKLMYPVFDLPMHLNLGFANVEHTGRICNSSKDYLLVPDYVPHRIPIVAVHELTPTEAAGLLQGNGTNVGTES